MVLLGGYQDSFDKPALCLRLSWQWLWGRRGEHQAFCCLFLLCLATLCWIQGAKDMAKFLPLQEKDMANTQQSPLRKPPGIPCLARQGALQKEPTPQSEPDPSHDLTLETGLDETLERSWATFSFGKENQTRIPRISLTAGCWDFSIYLENRLCCNTCALSLTGLSFSAHHFLAEAAHDSSTFPPFGLLALLPFCIFSVSCLGEEYPSKSTVQPDLHPAEYLAAQDWFLHK